MALAGLALIQLGPASARTSGTKTFRTAGGFAKAHWGSNVSISFGNGTITYRSNGIPNHPRLAEYAVPQPGSQPGANNARALPDPTRAQNLNYTITTRPKLVKKTTSTSGGTIGLMISGAVLFNPYEGDNSTVALADNFTVKDAQGNNVPFIDSCTGHPQQQGLYHYHGLPSCVTSQVDTETGPSHIIGVALDGFPIYGDRDIKGRQITVNKLDKCNGITSKTPEFPKGIYHYVLLNVASARSSLRCFHGKYKAAAQGPPMMTTPVMYCHPVADDGRRP
jgi:hypothetical protein